MTTRLPWSGGYIRVGKKRRTYVIDRWVDGIHFHVSTRCSSERAAMKQLEAFEANPTRYSPAGEEAHRLEITAELVGLFRLYMKRKQNSEHYVAQTVHLLAWWADALAGRDLRNLNVQTDIKAALERKTRIPARIIALKSFCSWLRTEKGLLKRAEDATLDLPVPHPPAAKLKRRRVVNREHVLALLPHLPPQPRDILTLLTGTAWHVSEVRRFAASGEIVRPLGGSPLAVLVTKHKSGEPTRTPINTPEHLAAAERILNSGKIPGHVYLARIMRDTIARVREEQARRGIPEKEWMPHFRMGVMRHSVITWAVEMGATLAQASEFAGHKTTATTRKYYLDLMIPTVSVPVLRVVKEGG
jgi:integrase